MEVAKPEVDLKHSRPHTEHSARRRAGFRKHAERFEYGSFEKAYEFHN